VLEKLNKMINWEFVVVPLVVFLILLIVLIMLKASYHFNYLKITKPDEFKNFHDYVDTYKSFDVDLRILLILPFFKRNEKLEENKDVIKLVKKIKNLCRLIYLDILLVIMFFLMVLIFFKD